MIRRTTKYLVMTAMIGFAAYGNAGTATVSPALAACSKALVESIAKSEPLPTYTVKAPGIVRVEPRRPEFVHGAGAQQEDQGAARQGLVQGDARGRDRHVQVHSALKS